MTAIEAKKLTEKDLPNLEKFNKWFQNQPDTDPIDFSNSYECPIARWLKYEKFPLGNVSVGYLYVKNFEYAIEFSEKLQKISSILAVNYEKYYGDVKPQIAELFEN